jgi:hypothetical protein
MDLDDAGPLGLLELRTLRSTVGIDEPSNEALFEPAKGGRYA